MPEYSLPSRGATISRSLYKRRKMVYTNGEHRKERYHEMTELIFVRHGYSEGNKDHRFSGQRDFPLDGAGRRQALEVAEHLRRAFSVDAIYASDLCRACDTVRPLAEALSLPIRTMAALREVDVGLWEGVLREDVERQYPETYGLYMGKPGLVRFDGGESFAEVRARAFDAVREIVAEHEGGTVVVATHGGVIRALRTLWQEIPLERMEEIPHVPNASVTVVRYEGEVATLIVAGSCDHLSETVTEKLVN